MRVFVAALLAVLSWPAVAFAGVIDDFESATSPAPWTFSNGPEFPGATGALSVGTGRTGKGAHLAYDFTKGGNYVGMYRTLANLPLGDTFAFWVRADPRARLTVQLTDAGGQTLNYPVAFSFESIADTDWTRMALPPGTASSGHWGGANDGVLHGSITNIGILVESTKGAPSVGAIDVDDVATFPVTGFHLDPFAAGASLPAESGDLFARWGANIHFTSDDRALDALHAAGFTWARMDLAWDGVEKVAGVYDFAAYDQLVASLEARAMKALLILDYGNPLYGGGAPPTDATAIAAFAAFSKAAAAHFVGKPVIFEIWNEPDGAGFWPPGNKPLEFAALLGPAIAAVHAGDPKALVSTGGVSWFFYDYFDPYLATGAAADADFIGVHGYRPGAPESIIGDYRELRRMVAERVPKNPSVLLTEWGYSGTDLGGDGTQPAERARQAVLAVRSQLSNWVAGTPISIWYDVRDDGTSGTDGESNFGLLAYDYSEKPAMTAMKQLAAAARGRRLSALLSTIETPRALRLEGAEDVIIVLWASESGQTMQVVAPAPLDAVDIYGAPLTLTPQSGEVTLNLAETAGPIYLRYAKPAASDGGVSGGGDGGGPPADGGATPDDGGHANNDGPDAAPAGGGGNSAPSGCGCRTTGAPGGAAALALGFALLFAARLRRTR